MARRSLAAGPARRVRAALCGSVLAILAATASAGAAPLDPACALPDPLVALDGRLDHFVARARSGAEVTIMAIGSSSTEGVGASAPDRTYPARLAAELAARLPAARIRVINRGIGGEVAATTARRLEADALALKPDLVVWQVGTNDAVRGVGAEATAAIVHDGVAFLARRGVDVVLMDPQLYPRIAADAGYAAVVARIDALAAAEKVPVMRRFDAMRHWAGQPNPPVMLWRDAFHMNDLGYACVAAVLAEGLARRVIAADRSDPAAQVAAAGEPAPAPSAAQPTEPLTH